jgi:hypothetical protein
MNAVDAVDHFTGGMALAAPQVYEDGRLPVPQQDAAFLQCAQQRSKDQAVGDLLIGVPREGDEDPAIVDPAIEDRISLIEVRHHHAFWSASGTGLQDDVVASPELR